MALTDRAPAFGLWPPTDLGQVEERGRRSKRPASGRLPTTSCWALFSRSSARRREESLRIRVGALAGRVVSRTLAIGCGTVAVGLADRPVP